jgi:hypothetical protein
MILDEKGLMIWVNKKVFLVSFPLGLSHIIQNIPIFMPTNRQNAFDYDYAHQDLWRIRRIFFS